ncbi:cytochrome b/b6 domain-containing protein [uncultured Rhodospira sp.]|uniref:cytochrome b/b6 domain-containing protein n=1 Tax=uncultured Rhodospira sp. TaxID=1936189 RepID=UPI00262B8168|nr:cytochrome b/b6 domain-containing protein [uncultured Rhodospira sp.]
MTDTTADANSPGPETTETRSMMQVWDPVVRIGHWVLVGGFLICYLTEGEPEWLHNNVGYLVAITVILRLVWGFIGPKHARFSDFVRGPGAALGYLRDELSGKAKRFIGHNPAGGLMALALLASLGATTYTGMAMLAEEGEGPLASVMGPTAQVAVVGPALADEDEHEEYGEHGGETGGHGEAGEQWEEIHEFFANTTLVLMALHILGVIASSTAHRENLVRAMIDGRKRA